MEEGQCLLQILMRYEATSGQAINRQKTFIFFSKNTRQVGKTDIQALLGVRVKRSERLILGYL